ncbi:MAG: peptidase M61, partial [Nonlabens sp.]|nr:peptidase M61 [Nonlabens sp.]
MKRYLIAVSLIAVLASCKTTKAPKNDLAVSTPIVAMLDLTVVNNDRVPVTINPGRFTTETVTYRMPRVV